MTNQQELPIKIVRCFNNHTEHAGTLSTAASLEDAKAKVAEEGYVVMGDGYEPYGGCETNDTWDGEMSHIVTIADDSILDDAGHVEL